MSSLKFKTSNVSSFSNNTPAYLLGKNGFSTELGTIPLLVTSASETDLDSNIALIVRGLNDLYDNNVGTHILNNNTFVKNKLKLIRRDASTTPEIKVFTFPTSLNPIIIFIPS